MPDVTFVGTAGIVTVFATDEEMAEFDRYVDKGYLTRWAPDVFELTDEGTFHFAFNSRMREESDG